MQVENYKLGKKTNLSPRGFLKKKRSKHGKKQYRQNLQPDWGMITDTEKN